MAIKTGCSRACLLQPAGKPGQVKVLQVHKRSIRGWGLRSGGSRMAGGAFSALDIRSKISGRFAER